jgi:starch phosphorylase
MNTTIVSSLNAGVEGVALAARALAERLPAPLQPLGELAYNYRWSWTRGGAELFERIDPQRWELCAANPVRMLQEVSPAALERLADDEGFVERVSAVHGELQQDLARPFREGAVSPERPVAFFCAEYAVHQSLPVYSGGLGVLAGDILKAASDLALPIVAVGLMYRHGYFRQRIDQHGYQHEYWVDTDAARAPAAVVLGKDGSPLTVRVPIAGRQVGCRVWRVNVGRVGLLLLDTDIPDNDPAQRFITSRLYVGDPQLRLAQYVVLGIGGVRALRALDIDPAVVHLNEGHAAFAALELIHSELLDGAESMALALAGARRKTVFTTHTPVPAGNDTYPAEQVQEMLGAACGELGVEVGELIRRGRTNPEDQSEPFGVTQFALRSSRSANGVAARHGEVARQMWSHLWPGRPVEQVPIGVVTNGVHIQSWLGRPMRALLDRYLGPDWTEQAIDCATWHAVHDIPDEDLWAARCRQRQELIDLVGTRSVTERLARGQGAKLAHAAAQTFSPDVLTVGFARRLATYKRLDLLMSDVERMASLLDAAGRPVQLVIAGKAHPKDEEGKRLVCQLFDNRDRPELARRIVFLEDYDMRLGALLTAGCDLWVNLPRPPLEASGTSGMKSAINGGLQLSVLDGWWPEAYDSTIGWGIDGTVDADHGAQDARHASEFYRLLGEQVAPLYYSRDRGLPIRWLQMIRHSLIRCGPRFGAGRMVSDYANLIYPHEEPRQSPRHPSEPVDLEIPAAFADERRCDCSPGKEPVSSRPTRRHRRSTRRRTPTQVARFAQLRRQREAEG